MPSSETSPIPGWLELRGLRCLGRHGAYPGEQEAERVFLVDVAIHLDLGPAAATDDLAAAVDFAALADTVRGVVADRPRTLLEALALAIAQAVVQQFVAADRARVRVAKPQPPGLDATEEAVEIELPAGQH